jgi:AraC-like DNA-binding protein
MISIDIKKYYPQAAPLKHLIKYFWVFESGNPVILNHKILPVSNIDILFNFLAPMKFEKNGFTSKTPGNIFFSGLSGTHMVMKQKGIILTIGVSFFPASLYPFFKIPVSEFRNCTIGLDAVLNHVAVEIEERLRERDAISEKIELLEQFLLSQLDPDAIPAYETLGILNDFYEKNIGVRDFCREYGVHPRKLERIFNKYVGVSPKFFHRLNRFQAILNKMMTMDDKNLTTLAHEIEFYDQTHFIKEFKSFSGSPPSAFLKEKKSLRQIIKNP